MPEAKDTLVIIDGNAIIHRAYHAIPPLSKNGVQVNAVYGFLSTLLKVYQDVKPTHLAVAFDVDGGTFRDKIFTGYKAKRVKADQELYDQIPLVHEAVRAFGVPIFTAQGYEADDVIGTMVKQVGGKIETVVVSGDMDLLQLVSPQTRVYLLRKGLSDTALFDAAAVKEKYGFPPEQVVDYKALRGDTSDNIPGVPGIGEKTATALLQKVGRLDEIYIDLGKAKSQVAAEFSPSVAKKLREGEASARMSYEIASIHAEVPGIKFNLDECTVGHFNRDTAVAFLQKFDFMSLVRRLPGEAGAGAATAKIPARPTADPTKLPLVTVGPKEWPELWKKLVAASEFVAKEVLGAANSLGTDLVGIIFALSGTAYFVSWTQPPAKNVDWHKLFGDSKKRLVGHDLKNLLKPLCAHGIEVKNALADVMIASYLLNSSTRAHDAASLAVRELQIVLPAAAQSNLFGPAAESVTRELAVAAAVWPRYQVALAERSDRGLFDEIEMGLIPVLARMELAGVALDTARLQELSREAEATIKKLTKKIWDAAGEEFNVASSVQLRDILYEKLGLRIPGIKKGKTGYSTAASELEKLRGAHPIIEFIEEYREIAKLQNTYLSVLPSLIHPATGRVHTHFNQAVAATGRLSSSDPNLQNIPIRTALGREIRDAFVAAPGQALIAADYSQIELRIVASLAEDETLMGIFARGEDVHRATAAAIHGVSLDQVTKEMRYAAKEVNFGVLYGMGSFGLAWRAGIPQVEAKAFIDAYFAKFAGVKKYIDETLKFAREIGYVETLFGRRRYIPELTSSNFQLRSAGERMAVNMPIQGTAADIMKLAMIAVDREIQESATYRDHVKLILQVHDELVVEAPAKMASEVGALVQREMVAAAKLRVPTEVQVGIGTRWGEIK